MTMTTSQYARAKELWAEGRTFNYIARETGAPWGSLKHYVATNRGDFPMRTRPRGHINEETMREVDRRLENGESLRSITKDMNINRSSVYYYRKKVASR